MSLLDKARRLLGSIFRRPAATDTPPANIIAEVVRYDMLERYRVGFNERVRELATRLASGGLTPKQFISQMRIEVRALHVFAQSIGKGGFANMTAADSAAIEKAVRNQFKYLERWATQLIQQAEINPDQVANRAQLYGGAATETLERAAGQAEGMPELPFYPADRTRCRTNCGCRWKRVKLEGYRNWDVFWVRAKNDSCETCLAREKACNPLKIREGKIITVTGSNLIAS